ncbi:MAG: T9SS type B sorting domain-containing protein [Prevotellaceae bacterium]|jgi:gliding motility-associated-like protein|nr:T9SS type B sorting domain-containing protein [Prevotellaceae bacterium]
MKNHIKILLVVRLFLSAFMFAQAEDKVPCNERLVRSIDFAYLGNDAQPDRWSLDDINTDDISVSTTTAYTPSGDFANVKMNGMGGGVPLNTTRQYAIVQNPDVLNAAQYADIPTTMMVINPKQEIGSTDTYATFSVSGLKTGITYYIEIKLWNVLDFDGRAVYNGYNVGSWNPLLRAAVKANAGDLWAGNENNSSWSGKVADGAGWSSGVDVNYRRWEMNEGNEIGRAIVPTQGGTYAVLNGKKELRNNATGFDIVLQRRMDGGVAQSVVLGIEYIKIYACEETSAIRITGNSYTVCEGLDYTLTAVGLNSPANSDVKWTLPDGSEQIGTAVLPITSPMSPGSTAMYVAEGDWARDTIIVTSKMCCFAYGFNNTIFEEHFSPPTAAWGAGTTCRNRNWADIPGLNESAWISANYMYTGNMVQNGCNNCMQIRDVCGLPTGYAVIKTSRNGGTWDYHPEVKDHTTRSSTGNSGFLAVNAGPPSTTDYFYKLKLENLCPNTTYEFSAWYASMAANDPAKVNLTFEIRDSDNKLVVPAVSSGDLLDYDWHETSLAFTTPESSTGVTEYFLQLLNTSNAWGGVWGNDIAIDDITVTKCVPPINVFYGDTVTIWTTCSDRNVPLHLDKPMSELATMVAGGHLDELHIQWYKSTNKNAPLTSWTLIPGATDSVYYATAEFTTVYYCAKVTSDEARAQNNQEPAPRECGNDAMSSKFTLTLITNLNVSVEKDNILLCEGDDLLLKGLTTSPNIKWGWAKDNVDNFISGYEMGTDEAKREFSIPSATAAASGDYYFVISEGDYCYASAKATVAIDPVPEITGATDICASSTLKLNVNVSGGVWSSSNAAAATVSNTGLVTGISAGSTCIRYLSPNGLCADSVEITVSSSFYDTLQVILCENSPFLPYSWRGNTYGASGTYNDNLSGIATSGCDSIYTLVLKISSIFYDTLRVAVCENDLPYQWRGADYDTDGTYDDDLSLIGGCDSIYTLVLTIKPTFYDTLRAAVCKTDLPYKWRGNNYNAGGVYNNAYLSGNACDSIYTLVLTVNPVFYDTLRTAVCKNDLPYTWRGNDYSAGGTYNDPYLSVVGGCDSIYTLILTVNPVFYDTLRAAVCENALPYVWRGKNYSASGTYDDSYLAVGACDSIYTLVLTVNPIFYDTAQVLICEKALPYLWRGGSYSAAGIYNSYALGAGAGGCDSIYTLVLTTISSAFYDTLRVAVCENALPYVWRGKNYSASGTYDDDVSKDGCTIIYTLELTVNSVIYDTLRVSVCENALPYSWRGGSYNAGGVYDDDVSNGGCTVIYTLELTVKPVFYDTLRTAVCESDLPYSWRGSAYNASGVYNDYYLSKGGCDSIYTLILTVNPGFKDISRVSVCQNDLPYRWRGSSYNAGGTYDDILGNSMCDSSYTLILTIVESPRLIEITPEKTQSYSFWVTGDSPPFWFSLDNINFKSDNLFEGLDFGDHRLFIRDYNGCRTDTVFSLPECLPYFPPYFSPNGDGLSDTWIIENLTCYKDIQLTIFDRFGKELITITNPDPVYSWNGIYLGKPMPSTDYWYILNVRDNGRQYVGHFTLLR